MDLRSVAGPDTQIYAIGVDVGGMALEVAQRGLSSMLSNRMAGLGRWSFDAERPSLRLADDVVAHLLERERSASPERVVIGVAGPAWFGIAERTRLADVIDPMRRYELVACSTTMAAAVGCGLLAAALLVPEHVVVLDLEVGCSASLTQIASDRVQELCTAGLSPRRVRGESSGAGIVGVSRQRERVMADLFAQAEARGCTSIDRILVVGDESEQAVRRLLSAAVPGWADHPLEFVTGRSVVARGAALLADPSGGLALVGASAATVRPASIDAASIDAASIDAASIDAASMNTASVDAASRDTASLGTVSVGTASLGTASVDAAPVGTVSMGPATGSDVETMVHGATLTIVGAVSKRVGVIMDDRDGVTIVHPVIERGHEVPSVHEQLFDLGPDDGSDVYLDLFEQIDLTDDPSPGAHRHVATAHLLRERNSNGARDDRRASTPEEATVVFRLGADGRFDIAPVEVWALDWHGLDAEIVAVRPDLVDDRDPSRRSDRATVRPLLASWSSAAATRRQRSVAREPDRAVIEPAVIEPVAVEPVAVEPVAVEPVAVEPVAVEPVAVEPVVIETAVTTRVDAEIAPVRELASPAAALMPTAPAAPTAMSDAVVTGPADVAVPAVPPTPAVSAALQRCERLLSAELGQMVTLRSVFALLDLPDGAPTVDIESSALRLERSLARRERDDHGTDALGDALHRAIAAVRETLRERRADWYFGGTESEVDDELSRVVEHLMVVVGTVSPAEQRRLVLDAQLLGLSAERAPGRIRDLVLRAHAARIHDQLSVVDAGARIVSLCPDLRRFVLDDAIASPLHTDAPADDPTEVPATGMPATGMPAAGAIRMRVRLDVR